MQSTDSTLSKRRRFQSSITTYFTPSDSTDSNSNSQLSHNHYSAATFSATPVLSAKVQSSLLSVGMRVRKSVADGYKTQIAMEKDKAASVMVTATQPYAKPSYSELAPFSGISRPSTSLATDDDAFSLPPSSQESAVSADSGVVTLNGQKRRLNEENDIFADEDSDLEGEESQPWQNAPLGRTILSPSLGQQRRRILATRPKSSFNGTPAMDLDDFEEASFLRRREEVDADYHMDCA